MPADSPSWCAVAAEAPVGRNFASTAFGFNAEAAASLIWTARVSRVPAGLFDMVVSLSAPLALRPGVSALPAIVQGATKKFLRTASFIGKAV